MKWKHKVSSCSHPFWGWGPPGQVLCKYNIKEDHSPVNLGSTQVMKLLSDVAKETKERSKPRDSSMHMYLFAEPTYSHRDTIVGQFSPSRAGPPGWAELLPWGEQQGDGRWKSGVSPLETSFVSWWGCNEQSRSLVPGGASRPLPALGRFDAGVCGTCFWQRGTLVPFRCGWAHSQSVCAPRFQGTVEGTLFYSNI